MEQHSFETDLNEQLFIIKQEGDGKLQQQYQGGLSKEERIKIAEEKIAAARIRRAEEDKRNKHEQEISRIKNEKALAAAKRIA